ncbi:MAG: hypothetical protein H0U75_12340 [Legionella sp.]|nr:hypothetical protein [Legionella sp.]
MKLSEIPAQQKGEPLEPLKKPDYLLLDDSKLPVDTFCGRVCRVILISKMQEDFTVIL